MKEYFQYQATLEFEDRDGVPAGLKGNVRRDYFYFSLSTSMPERAMAQIVEFANRKRGFVRIESFSGPNGRIYTD